MPYLSAAVVLGGVAVLVGWAIDSPALKSVIPGTITMKVNTALGLTALAVALAGLTRPSVGWRLAVRVCLAAAAGLALATLAQYVLGVDLRIDELFAKDLTSPRFPGRPAPATLCSLVGLSAVFALLHAGRAVAVAQAALFVLSAAPLASLGGYLYRAPGMFQHAPYPAIAVNTSAALLTLCFGGLFARADEGLMRVYTARSMAGTVARKLLPAAVAVPMLAGLLVLSGERAGFYSQAFGSALLVACCALFFAGCVGWAVARLHDLETVRAAAERRLAEGEQRLRIAAETAGFGSWQRDLLTGAVECSDQFRAHFGLAADAPVPPGALYDVMHPDDRDRVRAAVGRSLAGRTDYHAEYRVAWPDGTQRWIIASGRGLFDDAGRPTRMVGVTLDVTARKAAEAERERLLQAERDARARAQTLADEAGRANRAKDEFLATVSHELRTPLTAILGWAHVLKGGTDGPEELAQGLATIERNAKAQSVIIEDLLDMGRIIGGQVRLDLRPTDLPGVIAAALESMRPAADAKGVRLATALDPAVGVVRGDAGRLQQVVWNLLSNAIKFTPRGGEVRVTLRRVESHTEVAVADTGGGIPADFLPYVFDRFRQADGSTTRRYGGLGLGLAIVKHLVELHGGRVAAESQGPGLGSTFRVVLPLASVSGNGERAEPLLPFPEVAAGPGRTAVPGAEPSSQPASSPANLAGLRVLVVDDEIDARSLVKRVLEACDATATTAGSVDEAVARLDGGGGAGVRFDVIVSDIGMPDRDGYDLIRAVRGRPGDRGGQTPAVALTAYARPDDRARTLTAGFNLHVVKPVDPDELCAAVARAAGRDR